MYSALLAKYFSAAAYKSCQLASRTDARTKCQVIEAQMFFVRLRATYRSCIFFFYMRIIFCFVSSLSSATNTYRRVANFEKNETLLRRAIYIPL